MLLFPDPLDGTAQYGALGPRGAPLLSKDAFSQFLRAAVLVCILIVSLLRGGGMGN